MNVNKQLLQLTLGFALGGAIAGASALSTAAPAQAQAAYGSYVGVGPAFGLTSDASGNGSDVAGIISGRYRFLRIPLSVRAQAFFFGEGFAFVPTVSFDYPLNWNTDIYLGAGVSFNTGDEPSPVGDRTAFVLQPGVDYLFPNSRLTAFGNAVIAFDGFRDGDETAVSLQAGVGYRF